jgi:lysophospholipase L1-like esterase
MYKKPMSKTRILCYGDSNTWGQYPFEYRRLPEQDRWTRVLAKQLGSEFELLEEGLPGRTAGNIRLEGKHKNGLDYFLPCILSQYPFEILILALGTNDLLPVYNRQPKEVSEDLLTYSKILEETFKHKFKIILVSPPHLNKDADRDSFVNHLEYNKKAHELYCLLEQTSEKNQNFTLIDTSSIVITSGDGIHLDPISHQKMAELINQKLD